MKVLKIDKKRCQVELSKLAKRLQQYNGEHTDERNAYFVQLAGYESNLRNRVFNENLKKSVMAFIDRCNQFLKGD